MSGSSIASEGYVSFEEYTANSSPETVYSHLGYEPTCLGDYIKAWLASGEGIRACIGDYQTFLMAVIAIIDGWLSDEKFLDYVTGEDEQAAGGPEFIERRPQAIFNKRGLDHDIMDPHFFATRLFRWLHSKRNEQ